MDNNQEYYNSVMTKKLAKRIINLREENNTKWKDLASIIKQEYGDEFALEEDTITGMYLEYAARDLLDK